MMPAWYHRMNPRERVLSWIVAGTVFVLLNLWILSRVLGALGGAHKEGVERRAKLAEQALYVKERDLWTKREEWIRKHQPVLNNPAEASALLDQLGRWLANTTSSSRIQQLVRGRPLPIIKRFLLRLKLKVRGRRSYISFTMCNDRTLSSYSKMLIWPSMVTILQ